MDGERRHTDMADVTDSELTILKGSKILVVVEDALLDVIIVSYKSGAKVFQGALLDVTKKDSPFGIQQKPSEDPLWKASVSVRKENDADGDKFYSVSQRYTYYQNGFSPYLPESAPMTKKSVPRHRDQSVRMRRLRPRQVLCSHCRTLCNESISVQSGNVTSSSKSSSNKNRLNSIADRNVNSDIKQDSETGIRGENIPSHCNTSEPKVVEEATSTHTKQCDPSETLCDGDGSDYSTISSVELSNRMVLRKRKLQPNLNDYLDPAKQQRKTEMVADSAGSEISKSQMSCPVIKISYADPEGKDTVLKIPARLAPASDDDSVWCDDSADKDSNAKAARKALKKAKKEGHRKSWCQVEDEGDVSEKDKHHHHHHHHKHKLKRKRKRKEFLDKEDYDSENVYSDGYRPELNFMDDDKQPGWSLCTTDNGDDTANEKEFYNNVRSKCLKQKLSISLKRLSAKAYMRSSPKYLNDSVMSSSSESECGDVPDFPKHEPLRDMDKVKPLMMRIGSQNVKKCLLDNGREMSVGDIVWGKIQGFPWWPGKILALTVSHRDNGTTLNHQAHVAWFGSSTSSYMSCNQLSPFLDDFKLRHNKKKRGPYKEAIRQATLEAQPDLPSDLICSDAIS